MLTGDKGEMIHIEGWGYNELLESVKEMYNNLLNKDRGV